MSRGKLIQGVFCGAIGLVVPNKLARVARHSVGVSRYRYAIQVSHASKKHFRDRIEVILNSIQERVSILRIHAAQLPNTNLASVCLAKRREKGRRMNFLGISEGFRINLRHQWP
jgi:hypothetical protein